ncbi:MAG: DNA repair protein RecO [Candidatus Aminicenantes bacterium]|nr:DNA repair protein RecO [Candidatus Aminicenantes bacterium]
MPLQQSQAIILKSFKLGESDKIVVFFTRELGKFRGVARGARLLKNPFGGGLEPLTYVSLIFFEKRPQELVHIDSCDIIHSYYTVQREIVTTSLLAYLADLVDGFSQERDPNENLFRLLLAGLKGVESGVEPKIIARYFEIWLLKLNGLFPSLRSCSRCGRRFPRNARVIVHPGGGFLCPTCSHRLPQKGESLSPHAVRTISSILRRSLLDFKNGKELMEPEKEIELLTGRLILSHLGKEPPSLVFFRNLFGQER